MSNEQIKEAFCGKSQAVGCPAEALEAPLAAAFARDFGDLELDQRVIMAQWIAFNANGVGTFDN